METFKNFRKKVAEKCRKMEGDPLVSSAFVGYFEKVKNVKRDPLF